MLEIKSHFLRTISGCMRAIAHVASCAGSVAKRPRKLHIGAIQAAGALLQSFAWLESSRRLNNTNTDREKQAFVVDAQQFKRTYVAHCNCAGKQEACRDTRRYEQIALHGPPALEWDTHIFTVERCKRKRLEIERERERERERQRERERERKRERQTRKKPNTGHTNRHQGEWVTFTVLARQQRGGTYSHVRPPGAAHSVCRSCACTWLRSTWQKKHWDQTKMRQSDLWAV